VISVSPVIAAASPLLQLLAHLQTTRRAPRPEALRERAMLALRHFERQARELGIPMELLRPAHYALCASLDDVVLNTPWGATSGWANQTLVASSHRGAPAPDQFFDQLRQMLKTPQKFLPIIELIYLCLSLGFMGRYRQSPDTGEFQQIRTAVYGAVTAQRAAPPTELSPRWRGVTVAQEPSRRDPPVWVVLAAAVALCGGMFFWTSLRLNAASDGLQARALAAPPTRMPQIERAAIVRPLPPPPAPPEPTTLDRLRASLGPQIDAHAVSLSGTAATPIIRIPDRLLFASGSAVVETRSLPLLQQVSAALRGESGALQVIDYTDNQPIRTVRFPSNFQLSAARANTVRAVIARTLDDPARVSAEGRADADPIAPNTTAEGRELNRRVEIVLHHKD
jgi:type VI secretion system protein ImpK